MQGTESSRLVDEMMHLVHFAVDLDFAEETRLPSPAETVYKTITGQKARKSARPAEPGVHVEMAGEKVDIRWRQEACKIVVEHTPSPEYCVETVLSWLSQINKVARMGKISSTKVVTHWLLPAPDYDFASLERKYREKMIAGSEDILKGTFDSSAILDIHIGDCILHHQSGSMDPEQLLEDFLLFKPDEVPKVFLFLFASVTSEKVVEYSEDGMRQHLITLFGHCKSHSDVFGQIWEGVL